MGDVSATAPEQQVTVKTAPEVLATPEQVVTATPAQQVTVKTNPEQQLLVKTQ